MFWAAYVEPRQSRGSHDGVNDHRRDAARRDLDSTPPPFQRRFDKVAKRLRHELLGDPDMPPIVQRTIASLFDAAEPDVRFEAMRASASGAHTDDRAAHAAIVGRPPPARARAPRRATPAPSLVLRRVVVSLSRVA